MNSDYPPFYIGQPVVCVDPVGPLVKNGLYHCAGCTRCNKCGLWHMHVSEFPQPDKDNTGDCSKCDGKMLNVPLYAFATASRFAPITSAFQSITLEKVLEKETPLIGVN